jgi:hypothetical protein
MLITDFRVRKMDHDDPRYPDADWMKRTDGSTIPFSDVYLFEVDHADGSFECPFVVTRDYALTPDSVANIMEAFSAAVRAVGNKKAA